ncbi:MAG: hypothetical protein JWM80_115 [Cyanobacteria bacterium RYN_339]|nr:hypothetical protein [Cyanobacteria bacterium RYN_339]
MSPKENLRQLIEKLTDDQAEELERIAISMLPAELPKGKRCEPKSFEAATEAVFTKFDVALRNLAK